jgi:hypothetical protein
MGAGMTEQEGGRKRRRRPEHRETRALFLTGLYYNRLNDDEDFRRGLAELFRRLDELGIAEDPDIWAEARSGASWLEEPAAALHREVTDFCQRWPLPQRIWDDLAASYELYRGGAWPDEPPQLQTAGVAVWVPRPGVPLAGVAQDARGRKIRTVERQPWIIPPQPPPFLYDPLAQDREALERRIEAICRDIRESILAQVAAYEAEIAEAGWRLPPSNQKPEQAIERLYLRYVKGWSWGQIAIKTRDPKATEDPDPEGVLRRARDHGTAKVRRQVRGYAKDIGLAPAD